MTDSSMPHPAHPGLVNRDEEHLKLLAFYHFLFAGINTLFLVVFVILPLVMGPGAYGPMHFPGGPGPLDMRQRLLGGLLIGGLMILVFAMNGWSLKNRQNRISSMILSCVECLSLPWGMVLGISTLMVLKRESVKALFSSGSPTGST